MTTQQTPSFPDCKQSRPPKMGTSSLLVIAFISCYLAILTGLIIGVASDLAREAYYRSPLPSWAFWKELALFIIGVGFSAFFLSSRSILAAGGGFTLHRWRTFTLLLLLLGFLALFAAGRLLTTIAIESSPFVSELLYAFSGIIMLSLPFCVKRYLSPPLSHDGKKPSSDHGKKGY